MALKFTGIEIDNYPSESDHGERTQLPEMTVALNTAQLAVVRLLIRAPYADIEQAREDLPEEATLTDVSIGNSQDRKYRLTFQPTGEKREIASILLQGTDDSFPAHR